MAMSKGKERRRMAQERRLQAALRENLRRRKAQARGRLAVEGNSTGAPDERGNPRAKQTDKS
jgi:hypothetical protein